MPLQAWRKGISRQPGRVLDAGLWHEPIDDLCAALVLAGEDSAVRDDVRRDLLENDPDVAAAGAQGQDGTVGDVLNEGSALVDVAPGE
jgi:hypothetical protein